MINAVNDLQMTRKNVLEHTARPAFQGLRQDCVVRVRKGVTADLPGLKNTQNEN